MKGGLYFSSLPLSLTFCWSFLDPASSVCSPYFSVLCLASALAKKLVYPFKFVLSATDRRHWCESCLIQDGLSLARLAAKAWKPQLVVEITYNKHLTVSDPQISRFQLVFGDRFWTIWSVHMASAIGALRYDSCVEDLSRIFDPRVNGGTPAKRYLLHALRLEINLNALNLLSTLARSKTAEKVHRRHNPCLFCRRPRRHSGAAGPQCLRLTSSAVGRDFDQSRTHRYPYYSRVSVVSGMANARHVSHRTGSIESPHRRHAWANPVSSCYDSMNRSRLFYFPSAHEVTTNGWLYRRDQKLTEGTHRLIYCPGSIVKEFDRRILIWTVPHPWVICPRQWP